MRYRPSNFLAVSMGLILLGVAFACNHVTIASGRYGGVMLTSMVCGAAGLMCLAAPLARYARRRR